MAKNLVLNILAKDKTRQAFAGVRAGLTNLRSTVFSLQSAIIGIGAGLAVKSILNVGSTVEQLRLRFAFLFKGVKEGDKAFAGLIDFASRVPFSLEEIQAGAGNLAVVTKNAEELNEILAITGNVASVTGLDFRTTAEQIQRSFSSVIGSADLFRERGVRALLGFKAGVEVTTEDTIKRFKKLFGKGGEFERATEVLATSFEGTLSMLGDKLFKFRLDTAQAGFFDFIKTGLKEFNKLIEDNQELVSDFGKRLSDGLIEATKTIILTGTSIIQALLPVFSFIAKSISNLFAVFRDLPQGVQTLGLIGFLMLGRAGKGVVLVIGAAFDTIRSILGDLANAYAFFLEKLVNGLDMLGMFQEEVDNGRKVVDDLRESADKLKTPFKVLQDTQKETNAELDTFIGKMSAFLDSLKSISEEDKKAVEKVLNALERAKEETEKVGLSFQKVKDNILAGFKKDIESVNQTIAKMAQNTIKQFSKGLAEALVLGKELNMTMKEFAQRILVEIVAFTIQLVIQETIRAALIKDEVKDEEKKTDEMRKQLKIQTVMMAMQGNPMAILGFAGMQTGGAVSKGKPVVVGERGAELFIPNQTGQITQSARGLGGGAVNVNFTINTIDSRGFSEALVENRGTITSIINNALGEKGRSGLV